MTEPATATVHARAAVAGNPSDGYGGAVVSIPVPHFSATATVVSEPVDEFELIAATRARFGRDTGCTDVAPVATTTTIPRSVGLAGSSALVIATLKALAIHHNTPLTPDQLATMAHTIEREDLGIAGGWQDQIIQSRGLPMLMEFARPMSQRVMEPTTLPLYLAWSTAAAENSNDSHVGLRERAADVAPAMAELAAVARRAADALEAADGHTLKACINETFDLRASVMPIAPAHQHMIDTAGSVGAAANFAGSGGAILGVVPKDPAPLLEAFDEAGLVVITWTPAEHQ